MAEETFFRADVRPERSAKEREKLAAALRGIGAERPDEASLLALTSAKKKADRKLAYHALAESGSPAAIAKLIEELPDADGEAVSEALRRFGPETAAERLVTFAERQWRRYEESEIPIGFAFEAALTACACSDPDRLEADALKRLLALAGTAAAILPEPSGPAEAYAYIEAELEVRRVNRLADGILREAEQRRRSGEEMDE